MANKNFEIAIKIGGEVLGSLNKAVADAQKKLSTFQQNVARSADGAFRKAEKAASRVADNRAWRAAAAGAAAYTAGVGLSVKAAVDWDTAMAQVRKGLGDEGPEAMEKFSRAALKLSTEMPVPGAELLEIGSQFALAGKDISELIPLMTTASRAAVAFRMSGTEAADAMLALQASTGKSNEEIERLLDAINHVSDNIAGKVEGRDLLALTSDLAGVMAATTLTAEEFTGLGAAFLAVGTPVERARTGLKNLLNAMQAGTTAKSERLQGISMIFGDGTLVDPKASKKQKAAAKKSSMQLADELAQRMVDDPKAAIADLIQRMSKLGPKLAPQAAKLFLGEEGKPAIMPLLTNPDLVREALGLVANPMDYQGSMLREFENQAKSTSAQMTIFKNSITAVGISIGSALLPGLNALMKAIHPALQSFSEWAQGNKALVGTITMIGLALSGLIIAAPGIAALVSLMGSLKAAIAGMNIGGAIVGNLAPVMAGFKAGGMVAGVKAIGAAFAALTNPIGLTVLAIVGAGLAFKGLYDKVPAFREAADALWERVKTLFQSSIKSIQGILKVASGVFRAIYALVTGDGAMLANAWRDIVGGMSQYWTAVQDGLNAIIPGLGTALGALGTLLQGIFTADVQKMGEAWSEIKVAWDEFAPGMKEKVQGWLDGLPSIFEENGRKSIAAWWEGFSQSINPVILLDEHFRKPLDRTLSDAQSAPPAPILPPPGSDTNLAPNIGPPAPTMPRWQLEFFDTPGTDGSPYPQPWQPPDERARALGGAVWAGRPHLVGERRPEVFVPQTSGRIVPHVDLLSRQQKAAMTGSDYRSALATTSGGSMVVNVGGITIEGADVTNPAGIEAAVASALRQAERRWMRRTDQRVRLLLND